MQTRSIEFRRLPAIESVQVVLEPTRYNNCVAIEGYLDLSPKAGNWSCWCLNISSDDDSWKVEVTIEHGTENGGQTFRELQSDSAMDFRQLIGSLNAAQQQLMQLTVDDFAFTD